jgi:hypothetical protein
VKHAVIKRGKPGRPRKGSVPVLIVPYLRKRALSFAKWCAGWEFDLEETSRAINENADGRVLEAIRRDFPGCYVKIRKLKTIMFILPNVSQTSWRLIFHGTIRNIATEPQKWAMERCEVTGIAWRTRSGISK